MEQAKCFFFFFAKRWRAFHVPSVVYYGNRRAEHPYINA